VTEPCLRIDKFLWHIRLFKSRSQAQVAIENGHIRINSQRVEKTSYLVGVDDVITLPQGDSVIAIRVISIPPRRGGAKEAQACYIRL
jgi:ribosome-associated heat shock protein Hsp15